MIFVAIQWHISDILGLEREVASGSVRIRVYVVFFDVERRAAWEVECSLKMGADFTSDGEMVLPRSTFSWTDG